ncbi:MAG: class I SAM-dependent methyltransferase [Gemmatimonadales bacterium]
MIYSRYQVAAELASGRRVLEIGCGSGHGLGLIARRARSVVGGDLSPTLLAAGRRHYGAAMPLVRLSAERLPFADGTFDLVLFFEATYYVPDMGAAFSEVAHVLAPGGTVLFVNANPERPDFIRSPHSVHYHTADEFRRELEARGLAVTIEGAFPVDPPATGVAARAKAAAFKLARRVIEILHLVPRTLRGRARLKRLGFGKLVPLPPELPEGYAPMAERRVLMPGMAAGIKVVYIYARK